MKFKSIVNAIKEPRKVVLFLSDKGLFNWMPDEPYLKMIYRCRTRKRLNLENPQSFNEKLQWLKLYDRQQEYVSYVDKYALRKYIINKIGEQYLIPLIGVYENIDEIDFDKLPEQFVLKCTHDSGGVVICKDKVNLDIRAARKKLNKKLKNNYFYHGREWPYKAIKQPRIICEQYLVDESGIELKDYKLMCFNGKPKCFFVCLNRNSPTGLNVDIYDIDWNPMPVERPHHPRSSTVILKPKTFDKMIEFAEKLSKDIPFIRVDFYEVNGQLYIGELTFYPGSGYEEFTPESYDYLLGSWLEIPAKNANEF